MTVVTLHKILLLVLLGTGYYTRVRDGFRVHELYHNAHGTVIGGYQQATRHNGFAVQCVNALPDVLLTEKDARRFVETCPDPVAAPAAPAAPVAMPTGAQLITVDLGLRAGQSIKGLAR